VIYQHQRMTILVGDTRKMGLAGIIQGTNDLALAGGYHHNYGNSIKLIQQIDLSVVIAYFA